MAIKVYVEKGSKRTFAAAIDWPGWSRSGKDETSALQALVDYAPRYAKVLKATGISFDPPSVVGQLQVVERLKGDATTDFGAPGAKPAADYASMSAALLERAQDVLRACWRTLDAARKRAEGRSLRKGPRGGGRNLGKMLEHVLEAERGYTASLGWKAAKVTKGAKEDSLRQVREAVLKGLQASVRGEIPKTGPRGGKRWSARYFVRRVAWHVLDHAWEIEDRLE